MTEASHSSSTVILPELKDKKAGEVWKRKFVKTAICGKPEPDPDPTEAMYECLCDIRASLLVLADAVTRIEGIIK